MGRKITVTDWSGNEEEFTATEFVNLYGPNQDSISSQYEFMKRLTVILIELQVLQEGELRELFDPRGQRLELK